MENNITRPGGTVFKLLFIVLLLTGSIYLIGGTAGFGPFLNLEAILLVLGGTFLLSWAAYPVKEIFHPSRPTVLRHAAVCAIVMGVLATVIALIPVMWTVSDTQLLIIHSGAALAGLFYGFLLAAILLPLAARLE